MSEAIQAAAQATPTAATGTPAQAPSTAQAPAAQAASATAPEAQKAPAASAQAPDAAAAQAAKAQAGDASSDATKPEAKPAKDEKPVVPEKYDLKLPKDSALSDSHLEKLSSYAKEKGLSNEQAQSLLERESQAVSDYAASQQAKLQEVSNSWVEQAKNDKELGGEGFKQNAEFAKRVVTRFGTDEFKKELNKTGLGNHPELLRVFSRIGKAMSEDQLVIPGVQSGGKKSPESILYGDSQGD